MDEFAFWGNHCFCQARPMSWFTLDSMEGGIDLQRSPKRRRSFHPFRFFTFLAVVALLVWGVSAAIRAVAPSSPAQRGSLAASPATASALPSSLYTTQAQPTPSPIPQLSAEGLRSPYAYLIRLQDQAVFFDQAGGERIYPASMTKVMTALLAVEAYDDLSETVTVPEEIFTELREQNASVAGFSPGERVTVRDLVYGVLLPSGGDASLTLAQAVSGSEEAFVQRMNEKASELGMADTHFTNACGLHAADHYSTFREAFTASRYSVQPTNAHPEGFTFRSSLFANTDGLFSGGKILGGKTGYTSDAGLCLASLAEKDGVEYILVTAGAQGDHHTDPYHIEDALLLYGRLPGADRA